MSNDVREQLRSHFLIRIGKGTRRESLSLGCSSIKLPHKARHRVFPRVRFAKSRNERNIFWTTTKGEPRLMRSSKVAVNNAS